MIKRLGVVLFAKLQELAKGIAEGVSIVLQGNKKMEASSKKVSKSIEQSFGQGAKNAIKQTGEQMLIQTDILRDLEMGLKKLEEQQKSTGKYDFQAQAKIKKAIQEQTQAIADQKFALQGLKMQQQESKAALSESRAVAEDNSQAMEALSRAVNAAAMATLLLGDDNKKLQPAINAVRVVMAGASAAMALYNLSLRENNVLTMLSSKLQKAYAVVVGTSTGAMKMFRIALASTGVGVLIVALGALVAKLMETTEETSNLADEIERIDTDLDGFRTKVENVASEWEHWMNVQIVAAKMAGKGEKELQKIRDEAYDNQIKNIEALIQETYNAEEEAQKAAKGQIKDQAKLTKELNKIFAKYESERAKLDQDVFALRRKKELENLQLDYEISQEQKKINDDKLKSFLKAEEERQKGFKQYRAELLSEEKKLQQLSIEQMQEGKAKELAQLKFNFEQEIAEVKYSQELKKALTDKYNKDVAAVNTKYSQQELQAIGANLMAYVKFEQAKRDARLKFNKKANAEILAEQEKFNQKINEQFKNALNQFTQTVVSEISDSIKRAFEGVGEGSELGLEILKLQQKELEQTMKDMERSEIERLQARQQYLKNQEDILEQSRSNMSKLFRGIIIGIADFLIQMGTSLIIAAVATDKFKESLFTSPKAAAAAGAVAVTAGLATRAIMERGPRFANGGIVSGPTLGLVGEYPGASTNPEVIAPLDKLQSMLGGMGTGDNGFIAETRVSGRDLALVLSRYNKDAQRG
jgi:hypothetical protein